MKLNLDFVRSHFPALAGAWTFMDNAGGSQTLKLVTDRMSRYLLEANVQHGASYAVSQKAMAWVREATEAMQALVNAADPQEIVMGPSATALFRILSLGMARFLKPGDEIIVAQTDHEANVSPWTDLEREGFIVKVWNIRSDMQLHLEDLERLWTDRTRLLAVTHCSNVLGTIHPVRQWADWVHSRGGWICVDGVAYAPHRRVDVRALDVDFYVFSTYKVYGPHYGLLYGRKEHLLRIPGLNHYFIREDDLPYKFQPGNVNFELAYSMLGLTDYLRAIAAEHGQPAADIAVTADTAFGLFAAHEAQLAEKLLSFLNKRDDIQIIGLPTADPTRRVPTISFVQQGRSSEEIVLAVDSANIGIRFGDFYAKKLIEGLGLEAQQGVVRVSLVHYNTEEEVDRLIEVLEPILDQVVPA
ncbi:MAG: cysteine desulfurase-like protein [Bacteroidota bacterium]